MTIRLTLICQGATAATQLAAFAGDDDLIAAARIRMAAATTAARLGRFDAARTSPARAAVETASLLGLDATPDPDLREIDYGRWTGLTLSTVGNAEPEALAAWLRDPHAVPHGGESVSALLERAKTWLRRRTEEAAEASTQRLIAVTHASVMRAVLVCALGAPPEAFQRIDVGPLSRLVLSGRGAVWRLQKLDSLAGPER